jgi:hypothetical protein
VSGPERDSSESTWELLPAPPVEPLPEVDQYQAPSADAPDPRSLRLIPFPWVPWAIGATLLSGLMVWILVTSTSLDPRGLLGALVCLMISAWAWYQLVFAPRLTLDVEGLTFTTFGLRHDEISLVWSEIETVRLESSWTKLGNELSLRVTLRSDGTHGGSRHGHHDLDFELGMAGFRRVDRALRRYSSCDYSSSHSR